MSGAAGGPSPPARPRPVRVLGISGSLRDGSHTRQALAIALEGARDAGARVETWDLAASPLPFCNGHTTDREDPAAVEFCRRVKRADGIVLATPEYHGSLSGVLKNALDLLSFEEMSGKVCGLVSVLGGQANANALNHMRIVCRWVHAWVVPHQAAIGNAYAAFAEDGTMPDEKLAARIRRVGTDVVKYAHLLRENPELAEWDEE